MPRSSRKQPSAEAESIHTQPELEAVCEQWRDQGWIAFDTEFIRDDTYDALLCLVQVADGRRVTLVDPLEDGLDLAPFWSLVHDPKIRTIVHAGKEDFDVCYRKTGRTPRNVLDVQIAAGFLGGPYPLSLSRLVQAVLHRRIAKAQTLTDWSRRPLTDDQFRYAVEDVLYLPRVRDKLQKQLETRGRLAWADEECRQYEESAHYQPAIEDRVFKIKGSKRLDARGLAALGLLVKWRDRWAAEKNRPTRALVRDDILVEIARVRPTAASELEVLRGFPQAKNPRVVAEVIRLITEANALPANELPQPHVPRDDSPMFKAAMDLVSACIRAHCHDEDVSHELVATSARVRELMDFLTDKSLPEPVLLRGWRREFIGARLVDLLEGRSELHLTGWPDEVHLRVVTHGKG